MNHPEVSIRRATADDAAALATLGAATFSDAFGYLYTPKDLQTFLSEHHSVEAWQALLADACRATWVAALPDEALIGFVTVGACKLPVENLEPQAGEIQMLYVRKEYQNLRLGRRLMDAGLAWLEEKQHDPLYIGVWSENFGAQRFYGRYGFRKFGEYGFRVGKAVDREFILKRHKEGEA